MVVPVFVPLPFVPELVVPLLFVPEVVVPVPVPLPEVGPVEFVPLLPVCVPLPVPLFMPVPEEPVPCPVEPAVRFPAFLLLPVVAVSELVLVLASEAVVPFFLLLVDFAVPLVSWSVVLVSVLVLLVVWLSVLFCEFVVCADATPITSNAPNVKNAFFIILNLMVYSIFYLILSMTGI